MSQPFDDELLNVILKFSNPNKGDMVEADKLAGKMAMSLDNVIRKAVAAGKSVGEVFEQIKQLEPALKSLEKRSGNIGAQANALRSAQQSLSRYTPDRLERMAESAASRIAETSGTAALRRQLEQNGELTKRLIATQEGRYDRTSRGSNIGRGLYIDVETTGLNALKHQIVELTATLFSFNKQTGEIKNAAEKTYHGFQQLNYQSRHQYIPGGLSASQLQGQAISATILKRLMQQSDFLVAHNAPFDKKFLEKLVPQSASMQWFDSMRGVQWKNQGFNSRALQDLLRAHGIEAGTAHRSSADVSSGIKLLGSRSPLGGSTYMSQLLGSQGPLNKAQQTLAVIKQIAEETRSSLQQRLGDSGRANFSRPTAAYTAQIKNYASRAADDVAELFSSYVVHAIEGGVTARARRPSRSTDYGIKQGSGVSAESTPGQLGESAIHLDRSLATANEFIRNLSLLSGPGSSNRFLNVYQSQSAHQEGIQRSRGLGPQRKLEIRTADDFQLATMSGVNTQLRNERLGLSSSSSRAFDERFDELLKRRFAQKNEDAERMLSQPWAKPTQAFSPDEITSFIAKHKSNQSVESIRPAAQMASHVGPTHPQFGHLVEIMMSGQATGRMVASANAVKTQQALMDRLTHSSSTGKKSPFRNVISSALGQITDVGLAGAHTMLSPFTSAGGIGFGGFGDFLKFFQGRRKGTASGHSPLSYEERANMELPESTTLRGSIRQDALESKLRKLETAVDETTKSFERYKNVSEPIKRQEASVRYGAREFSINQALNKTNASADSQLATLQTRRDALRRGATNRLQGIQTGFEGRSSALGFGQLDAETQYENAIASQKIRAQALRKSKAFTEGRIKPEDIEQMTNAPVRSAQMKLIKANYAFQASQLTDQTEIDKLRARTAAEYSVAKYGQGGGAAGNDIRARYATRVSDLLGGQGPTLAQANVSKAGNISQDFNDKSRELDQRESLINDRKTQASSKADQSRVVSAAKAQADIAKIDDEGARKFDQVNKKKLDSDRKATEAKIAYLKREDASGGAGGSGGTGGGRGGRGSGGGGGSRDFASREGYDFGVGLAGLAAYGAGVSSLIKQSAEYAARTQTLQAVTRQMAQVNGLNTTSVEDEVSAMVKMNVTTQDANTVVQKMMFSQLDVAKATDLARVAQNSATLANVNSSEALERIILGIVTGQTRVLHNMGLQVSMAQVTREIKQDHAATGQKSDPTEYEKRQGMLNKVLLEGAKINGTYERSLTTAGGQFNLLSRDAQEAENAVGKEFLPVFGQTVSMLSSGLKFVEANSAGFSKLAAVLASVSAGASAIGSISFIKWMMTAAGPMPWWAKLAGVGVAAVGYSALTSDKSKALTNTSTSASQALQTNIASLQKERDDLMSHKSDTPEWKNTLAVNTAALASAADSQKAITEELTSNLAVEYNKRIKDLDDYIAAMEGKSGTLSQFAAVGSGSPETSWIGAQLRNLPVLGQTSQEDIDEAKRQKAALAGKLAGGGVSADAIANEAQRQRNEASRQKLLSPSIINKQRLEVQAIIAQMSSAEGDMSKLDERLGEEGSFSLKSRKMMGSPRQKVQLDYEQQTDKISELGTSLTDLKAKADKGDAGAKSKMFDVAKSLGAGSYTAGIEKVNGFLSRQQDLIKASAEDRDIALGKINNATQAQIVQITEEIDLEKIRAGVVQGSYASELEAIDKIAKRRMQTVGQVSSLTQDTDAARKDAAQVKAQAEVDKIKLKNARDQYYQDSHVSALQQAADVKARGITDAPGDAAEALRGAFKARFDATASITDDKKRTDDQLKLIFELDDAFIKLAKDKKVAAAETRISEFADSQELSSEIDRIISTRRGLAAKGEGRQSDQQRASAEIERTRRSQIAVATEAYSERAPLTPASGQEDLVMQRDAAIRQANNQAAVATIKQLEQNVEAARTRLVDTYSKQFQTISTVNELTASGSAEEQDAALNNHKLKLEYIQKEYEARGKSVEAERLMNEETQQADFDRLQQLLSERKKGIEGLRSFSGSMFDIITSHEPNKTFQARQFAIGQAKDLGRTMFQNLSTEVFKGTIGGFGDVIPGQETKDASGKVTPTLLGKVLGGTLFGKTHLDEIPKLQAKATEANTKAENDLKKAVEDLDKTIRDLIGSRPGTQGTTGTGSAAFPIRVVGIPSGSGGSGGAGGSTGLGPLFGGSTPGNPYVFNLGTSYPRVTGSPGSSGSGSLSIPSGMVSSALNFGSGPISTGPGVVYSGAGRTLSMSPSGGSPLSFGSYMPSSGGFAGPSFSPSFLSSGFGGFSPSSPTLPSGIASSSISYDGGPMQSTGGAFSLPSAPDYIPGGMSVGDLGSFIGQSANPMAGLNLPSSLSYAPGGMSVGDLGQMISQTSDPLAAITAALPAAGMFGSTNPLSKLKTVAGITGALGGAPVPSAVAKDISATTGLLSGLGKLAGPMGLGGNGTSTTNGSPSTGSILAGSGMALGGAYQAYNGFSKGGVSGIASGVGGALTAAAGITSMIPGAQIATPFLMAGGLVSDFVGSMFGNSRQQRGYDIQNYLDANKYIAPVALNSTQSLSGNMISYNKSGIARDSGIGAFPMSVNETTYDTTPSKTWANLKVPEYYTIPGQMNYSNLAANANPVNYNVTLPISAMDSKDVMSRSGDIALALKKELNLGNDVSVSIQNAVFGTV